MEGRELCMGGALAGKISCEGDTNTLEVYSGLLCFRCVGKSVCSFFPFFAAFDNRSITLQNVVVSALVSCN